MYGDSGMMNRGEGFVSPLHGHPLVMLEEFVIEDCDVFDLLETGEALPDLSSFDSPEASLVASTIVGLARIFRKSV